MKARAIFAAIVTLFQKPDFIEPLHAPAARSMEQEGIVSQACAWRVTQAFQRLSFTLRGGG